MNIPKCRADLMRYGICAVCSLIALCLSACSDSTTSSTASPVSITGTVTGLDTGRQVILLNNGTDSTTATSNTTFTFSTTVVSGGSYAVTVGTQPIGQTCTVTNGVGSSATANVTNVGVACVSNTPTVTTYAGTVSSAGNLDLIGTAAKFQSPAGITVYGNNIYIADVGSIRKINIASSQVSTVHATSSSQYVAVGSTPNGLTVYWNDSANANISSLNITTNTTSSFGLSASGASGISLSPNGQTAFITSYQDSTAYVMDTATNTPGSTPVATGLHNAAGVAYSPDGASIFVASAAGHAIYKINTITYATTVFAGSVGSSGFLDGTGTAARFNRPLGLVVDSAGYVFVADTYNHVIRKITPSGDVTTYVGTQGVPGHLDGSGTNTTFNYPNGVAVDSTGTLYVSDTNNYIIRKVVP